MNQAITISVLVAGAVFAALAAVTVVDNLERSTQFKPDFAAQTGTTQHFRLHSLVSLLRNPFIKLFSQPSLDGGKLSVRGQILHFVLIAFKIV